eukprot:TRINITY_DN4118_c0_g2_i1.p1 TRINITY_DN4118_c0_g2~~TRINITY_DN4118_c0_g2_i1.p1  ORF type:complete len:398 (+),score=59.63 TRINITY_DN4118_c0_g2_i1:98-1291(+)
MFCKIERLAFLVLGIAEGSSYVSSGNTRCAKAPPPIPQDPPFCEVRVGTCRIFGCYSSRGATDCIHGKCICKAGTCDRNNEGKCTIPPPSPPPLPAFCEQGSCEEGYCQFPDLSAEEAVSEMNRRFNLDDTGVLIRGFSVTIPTPFFNYRCKALNDPSTCWEHPLMSFSLMNKFAWDAERGRHSLYPKPAGLIALPTTPMRCLFPSDAGTDARQFKGCGVWQSPKYYDSNSSDYCEHFPEDFLDKWHGYLLKDIMPSMDTTLMNPVEWTGCALRGDKQAEMLKLFNLTKAAKHVKQGPFHKSPFGHDGETIPTSGTWNEALADGVYWNRIAGTNLEAFFIMDDCHADAVCKAQVLQAVSSYEKMFDRSPPLVGLNLLQKENPFYVLKPSAVESAIVV